MESMEKSTSFNFRWIKLYDKPFWNSSNTYKWQFRLFESNFGIEKKFLTKKNDHHTLACTKVSLYAFFP